jgi:hypothetical protein
MAPDLASVRPDLPDPPQVEAGEPGPGRRVAVSPCAGAPSCALYLPPEWTPRARMPVIVEYPGNGPYANAHGDTSSGLLEDTRLGWGISGGRGCIWLALPFVAPGGRVQQRQWWGDRAATIACARAAVAQACERFGGDAQAVVLAGFSRGAIACNYIGLADETVAGLWRAMVAHSHYDGLHCWGYPEDGRDAALARLRRLRGRPQFISHEVDVAPTRDWLAGSGIAGDFTCVTIPFRNHSADWVQRDLPERRRLRAWLARALGGGPG